MTSVVCVGECMVELRRLDATTMAVGHGGDTLNVAVYLARSARAAGVAFVTAVGDDPYSAAMTARLAAEGLDVGGVVALPGRTCGLYAIDVGPGGERAFTYWRGQSAARELFGDPATVPLLDRVRAADLVHLSGITLSVLAPGARQRLWGALDEARDRGGLVALDTNYRPAGWAAAEEARAAIVTTLARTDIALPSLEDQRALFGDTDALAAAERLHALGVREVVVKASADGCLVSAGGSPTRVPTPRRDPVDTTAAGDAFDGAYLAARLRGVLPIAAALQGNRLAATVIQHPGALIPAAAMPGPAAPSAAARAGAPPA